MDAYLLIRWSKDVQELRLPLFGQTIRVGHDPYNDVVLPGDFQPLAPYHAVLYMLDNTWYIDDPKAVGTLYCNGQRVTQRMQIYPGQPFYIGYPKPETLYLRLEIEHPQMTVAMSPPLDEGDVIAQSLKAALPPPNVPEAVPYLVYGVADQFTAVHQLEETITLVGRNPATNLSLPPDLAFVSGYHFQILQRGDAFVLLDKTSTNGTRLNNQFIPPETPMYLQDGDIISIMVNEPGAVVWFVFHDPFNPQERNIIRTFKRIGEPEPTPKSLWARIRAMLGR